MFFQFSHISSCTFSTPLILWWSRYFCWDHLTWNPSIVYPNIRVLWTLIHFLQCSSCLQSRLILQKPVSSLMLKDVSFSLFTLPPWPSVSPCPLSIHVTQIFPNYIQTLKPLSKLSWATALSASHSLNQSVKLSLYLHSFILVLWVPSTPILQNLTSSIINLQLFKSWNVSHISYF